MAWMVTDTLLRLLVSCHIIAIGETSKCINVYIFLKIAQSKKMIKPKTQKKSSPVYYPSQTGKSAIDYHKNVAGLLKFSLLRGDAKEFYNSQQLLLRLYLRLPGVYVVILV